MENRNCTWELSNGQNTCHEFAAYITNPESEYSHSYPEIHRLFPDSPTDEEIEVSCTLLTADNYLSIMPKYLDISCSYSIILF